MKASKLTSKSQATVPEEVRKVLGVKPGDSILWLVEKDGTVKVSKALNEDLLYLKSIESGLSEEWLSENDEKAFRDL